METYSTELVSDIYSGMLCEEQAMCNKTKDYDVREYSGSAAEVSSVGPVCSKRHISNAKAQLSAQVMNLPYDDFCESIPINTSRIVKTSDDYNIFKRIKEAYAACTCKICRCLAGNTIAPRAEFCDCEPCKCKDCTSKKDNIKRDSINFKRVFVNESHDKLDYKNQFNDREICNCKPCDCIQCSKNHSYYDRSLEESDVKVTASANNTFETPAVIYDSQREKITFDTDKFPDYKCESVLNETYKPNETEFYPGITRELIRRKNDDGKIHHNSLNNKRPINNFLSLSNKKCLCSVCDACLVCESKLIDKDNRWLHNMDKKHDFNQKNLKSHRCLKFERDFCSHENEVILMKSQEHSKCMCHVCHCLQCEGDSVLNRGQRTPNKLKIDKTVFKTSCKCEPCECKDCELRMSKPQISCSNYNECRRCQRENSIDEHEISKTSAFSKMQENLVLSNPIFQSIPDQCRACSEIALSKQNSNICTHDKLKHGNVAYVPNKDRYISSNKMYGPQSTIKDTNPKQDTCSYQRMDIKNKDKKSAQFKHDVFTGTPRSISPTKSTNTPATMPILTTIKFRTFTPGSRSTQTVTTSSSILSCHTMMRYSTCSISSPDTNSVEISTKTASSIPNCQFEQIKSYSHSQYEYQRNIFRCTGLKTNLDAIKTNKREYTQDTVDTEESLVESLLSDPFAKYLLKSCNNEQKTKSTYETVRLILQKAKELTVNMKTILQKYEKANSQFESLSKTLKKSQQTNITEKKKNKKKGKITFIEDFEFGKSGPHDPIKKNFLNTSTTNRNKSDMMLHKVPSIYREPFRSVNSFNSIPQLGTAVDKTTYIPNTYSVSDSEHIKTGIIKFTPSINKPIMINKLSQTKQSNMAEIAKRTRDELNNNYYNDNCGLLPDEEKKSKNKKVDYLRTRKIRDILKQDSQSDIFTERVPSSRTMSLVDFLMDEMDNHQ